MTTKRYLLLLLVLVAAASLPSALEEARQARWQDEGDAMLATLAERARDYALTHKRLPPSAGPTPPLGSCCWYEGGKCPQNTAQWQGPWMAWRFAIADAHRFSYEMTTSPDGQRATLTATADLGCRGKFTRKALTLVHAGDGRVAPAK